MNVTLKQAQAATAAFAALVQAGAKPVPYREPGFHFEPGLWQRSEFGPAPREAVAA